jgi:hypothetical protein
VVPHLDDLKRMLGSLRTVVHIYYIEQAGVEKLTALFCRLAIYVESKVGAAVIASVPRSAAAAFVRSTIDG